MNPCEAVRVYRKHRGWINQNSELRQAMDTLAELVQSAHDANQAALLEDFARSLDQLEEPA